MGVGADGAGVDGLRGVTAMLGGVTALAILTGCSRTVTYESPPIAQTATPTSQILKVTFELQSAPQIIDPYSLWPEAVTPEPVATLPAGPEESAEGAVTAASSAARYDVGPSTAAIAACEARSDRYAWREYAAVYDWPLDELARIVSVETGGTFDLCAVNPRSGATCWIQQYPGGDAFLDPKTCMAQGYAKWRDGGRSFYAHWLRWWN